MLLLPSRGSIIATNAPEWSHLQCAIIERQLEQVLASAAFTPSTHLQQLLRYLVEETLAGRAERLNQYTVAMDVHGRDAKFDPSTDSIVRVEAGRLRTRLREYYYDEGQHDEIRFELPKGHYIPRIVVDSQRNASPGAGTETARQTDFQHKLQRVSEGISGLFGKQALLLPILGILILLVLVLYNSAWLKNQSMSTDPTVGLRAKETSQSSREHERPPLNSPVREAPPTDSLIAYENYLKGRQEFAKRNRTALARACALFQQAIDHDPDFALAYVGLAESLMIAKAYGGKKELRALAEPLIERALALNDQLGEAHAALAMLKYLRDDFEGARISYEQSLKLNPNSAQTYRWYSILLMDAFHDEGRALALIQRAVLLNPLSPLMRVTLGNYLAVLDRPDDAMTAYRKAIELDPDEGVAYWMIGQLHEQVLSQPIEAARWFYKAAAISPDMPWFSRSLATLYLSIGDFDATRKWQHELMERGYLFDANVVCAFLENAMDNEEPAAACAEKVLSEGSIRQEMLFVTRNADIKAGRYDDALKRYKQWYPDLLETRPNVNRRNIKAAIDLSLVLQGLGQSQQADHLLQQSLLVVQTSPRNGAGDSGYGISDVEIHSLLGEKAAALDAMSRAIAEGWQAYYRRVPYRNPNLALLRGNLEFGRMLGELTADLSRKSKKLGELERSGELARIPSEIAPTN